MADFQEKVRRRSDKKSVIILGVPVWRGSLKELVADIDSAAQSNGKSIFDYANIHALNLAYADSRLREFYKECESVFCDGVGVKWAADFLGRSINERFTPPDWIDLLADQCVAKERSLFFLGGKPGVADKARSNLADRHSGLRIAGTHHGYFDKNPESLGNQQVVNLINRCNPDILLIEFGIPMQELWLSENTDRLSAPVFLAVGAMFDYLAGDVPRGPRWMTDSGLEWLSRLIIEPRRLWRRYIIGIPQFCIRILRQKLGMLGF